MLPEFKQFLEGEKAIEGDDESVKELYDLIIDADGFVYNVIKTKEQHTTMGETDEGDF